MLDFATYFQSQILIRTAAKLVSLPVEIVARAIAASGQLRLGMVARPREPGMRHCSAKVYSIMVLRHNMVHYSTSKCKVPEEGGIRRLFLSCYTLGHR